MALLAEIVAEEFWRYASRLRALEEAGEENFRQRRWRGQRQAMAQRVTLAEETVMAVLRRGGRQELANTWPLLKPDVLGRAFALPAVVVETLLFALSQHVLELPDASLLTGLRLAAPPASGEDFLLLEGSPVTLAAGMMTLLADRAPFADLPAEEAFLASRLREVAPRGGRVTALRHCLYRNQHAYLIGRLQPVGAEAVPLCVPLVSPEGEGAQVDALLTDEPSLLRVFEFTRSPFLVRMADPCGVVAFLHGLMPSKDVAQLVINLGFPEWGKALILKAWEDHVAVSAARMEHAPGTPGLVMLTFCLPDFPLVFKVVRNRAKPPKRINRQQVMERYSFVAQQDRVGRMADAQCFSAWSFPRALFSESLWEDLLREASDVATHVGDRVVLRDVITERKLQPLDLFVFTRPAAEVLPAVLDYGQSIKEMAMSNIFPGDLLLKNFGVTSLGRVVFYDYDEVCPLTECHFRTLPEPQTPEQEMAQEPWYYIAPNDVFPEEFGPFVTPPGEYGVAFREHHGDLFAPDFWRRWKAFHEAGRLVDLQPYPSQRRQPLPS